MLGIKKAASIAGVSTVSIQNACIKDKLNYTWIERGGKKIRQIKEDNKFADYLKTNRMVKQNIKEGAWQYDTSTS